MADGCKLSLSSTATTAQCCRSLWPPHPLKAAPQQAPQHAAAEPELLLLSAPLDCPGHVPAAMSFTGGKLKLKGGQSLGGVDKKKKKKRKAPVEDETAQESEGQEVALSTAQVGEELLL